MSNTKRFDTRKTEPKRGAPMFRGETYTYEVENWKETRDKKKYHKPGRKVKKALSKGKKAKKKIDLSADFDNIPNPVVKKNHVWNYN